MAKHQKALKFCLRLMLPIFALGGFGAVWGLLQVGVNQEKTVSAVWSQDRHYRASVVVSTGSGGCGATSSSFVVVERQNFLIKTGEFAPFCLDGRPQQISLSWKDSSTLAIACSRCDQNYGYADENWGKLHFSYDLDKP